MGAVTYHKTQSSKLYYSDSSQQSTEYFPAILALDLAAANGNNEAHEGRQLSDGGKAHEEAARPPHGAKILVVGRAIELGVGEGPAWFTGQGSIAIMVKAQVL